MIRPKTGIAMNGDYYVNQRLGLGFVKPSTWKFEAFKDFSTEAKDQVLSLLSPEEEEEELKAHASTLLATISKYGDERAGFSPSITVHKNQEGRMKLKNLRLDSIVALAIDGFSMLLKDYEVFEPPLPCKLSKCAAVRYKARWRFEHRKMQSLLIDDETVMIDQKTVLFTIHLYDSPYSGDTTPAEFRRFFKSLHIA